jgi:lambda repressor-like predicted transcriptional regulator
MFAKHDTDTSASREADIDPAFIVALLHQQGNSLRRLAVANGYSPRTFSTALYRSYPKIEAIIAKALGRSVVELWPERVRKRESRRMRSEIPAHLIASRKGRR